MYQVSQSRLLVLRALYALMAVGLGLVIWPRLLGSSTGLPGPSSVVHALLGALGLLAALGLRYPLQLLPVLLFELLWKTVWVAFVAWPAWRRGELGNFGEATFYECLPVFVLFPVAIPWRHVWARYVLAQGEPWRAGTAPGAS